MKNFRPGHFVVVPIETFSFESCYLVGYLLLMDTPERPLKTKTKPLNKQTEPPIGLDS